MPYVRLHSRMIPSLRQKAHEPPFVLEEICDPLEYEKDNAEHRDLMIQQMLLEQNIVPGRAYEGQLWRLIDETDAGNQRVIRWMAGGKWSAEPKTLKNVPDGEVSPGLSMIKRHARVVATLEMARACLPFFMISKSGEVYRQVVNACDKWLASEQNTDKIQWASTLLRGKEKSDRVAFDGFNYMLKHVMTFDPPDARTSIKKNSWSYTIYRNSVRIPSDPAAVVMPTTRQIFLRSLLIEE